METQPKRGRGRPPKHPRPTTPPPDAEASAALPEEIVINAPLAPSLPTPAPPAAVARPAPATAADFFADLDRHAARMRQITAVRVLGQDAQVAPPRRRRLYERNYGRDVELAGAELHRPVVRAAAGAQRDAAPGAVPPDAGAARRWVVTERVLLGAGFALAGVLGLVLLLSAAANWVLSRGTVRYAAPTAVARMSPPLATPPPVFADVAPPVQAPATMQTIYPTPAPVLVSSISYAPPPEAPVPGQQAPPEAPVPAPAPPDAPPANPAPPPVADNKSPIIVDQVEASAPPVAAAPPLLEAPTYDDPNISSGGSIPGQPPVGTPAPPPLASGGGEAGTPAHPIFDDPQIISGGSIGGQDK